VIPNLYVTDHVRSRENLEKEIRPQGRARRENHRHQGELSCRIEHRQLQYNVLPLLAEWLIHRRQRF